MIEFLKKEDYNDLTQIFQIFDEANPLILYESFIEELEMGNESAHLSLKNLLDTIRQEDYVVGNCEW